MKITLHLERSEDGIVWWAESSSEPGFSAAAPTLAELKALILEAIEMESWSQPEYSLAVAVPTGASTVPSRTAEGEAAGSAVKTLVTAAG